MRGCWGRSLNPGADFRARAFDGRRRRLRRLRPHHEHEGGCTRGPRACDAMPCKAMRCKAMQRVPGRRGRLLKGRRAALTRARSSSIEARSHQRLGASAGWGRVTSARMLLLTGDRASGWHARSHGTGPHPAGTNSGRLGAPRQMLSSPSRSPPQTWGPRSPQGARRCQNRCISMPQGCGSRRRACLPGVVCTRGPR